jgi:anthranilate synthase component I
MSEKGPLLRPVKLAPAALLELHAAFPDRYPALLESAAVGPLGRFDILFAAPGARLTLKSDGSLRADAGIDVSDSSFLAALDRWWRRERCERVDRALPFHGGWLLLLGYELAGQIEPTLQLAAPASSLIAQAVRTRAAIVYEHATQQSWIVAEAEAASAMDRIAADLQHAPPLASPETLLQADVEEDPPERYLSAVRRALDYISAGDIYQANLSRGWRGQLAAGVEPHDLYRRLRQTNPGPFCGVARFDDVAIVSSSPERLIEIRDGWITTRPIAGTRPRGTDSAADLALMRELSSHPKERAEHVMLIDLERNDLGRVCEAGSVRVDEFMIIESYAHVHHIVSNVRGRLRGDVTPGQALAAVFPGGTITGCPKVHCMELIAELEGTARGAYTGSLGYLNRDGSMDMNILIRSLEVRGRELTLRAGAGIVADSNPRRELEETRAKARGVLRALGAGPDGS